ncbi:MULTISPECIES: hypothetical protein [unclassified Rhizobium]|uniref:hypothetical protein n=1 Tax=unclassified Rhizobium TaxID=2613769 RepID=UPI001AD964FD|nr:MULTISPECIES: hypothetical protein [unclassified Rhizobium]MBO9100463.1 hypothetical protein [Rhizobium sp. L58/93]MBO9136175.1 hypothetical protein [Rhizobium sp. B209b/85]MBO9171486.1 hypothetical protein [Rhizobium sp. L245/93]MBO9187353.1 hypothetical protein [Rhizobium sp. E27B/91]QXZ88023.1 hypothetical protein J5287_29070 [Rhizobium sp. K1/93]
MAGEHLNGRRSHRTASDTCKPSGGMTANHHGVNYGSCRLRLGQKVANAAIAKIPENQKKNSKNDISEKMNLEYVKFLLRRCVDTSMGHTKQEAPAVADA